MTDPHGSGAGAAEESGNGSRGGGGVGDPGRAGRPADGGSGGGVHRGGGAGPSGEITFEEFQRVRIHAGTIVEAKPNPKARVPAYVLRIDFGPLGMRTSSAQITRNYTPETLVGRQIVAVLNFPIKRVAGVRSEVLVLGTVNEEDGVVLLHPSSPVADGSPVA